MVKRKRLNLENIVRYVLVKYPQARDGDGYCYVKVASILLGVDAGKVTLEEALIYNKEFPKTESVRRTRQKLQNKNPELRSSQKVAEWRKQLELEFREYAHA